MILLVLLGLAALIAGLGIWAGMADLCHPRLKEENIVIQLMRLDPGPTPRALDAETAHLADDTRVIGVIAGGQARANVMEGFCEISDHVLNDVLGGVACTVTYCPLSGCTRVFVDRNRSSPLAVAVGGFMDRSGDRTEEDTVILLRVDQSHYFHDTGQAIEGTGTTPYPTTDFTKTTWGEWRRAHPTTDVVDGPAPPRNANRGGPRPHNRRRPVDEWGDWADLTGFGCSRPL